ncbi:MAG: hypothetical protein MJ252_27975 [archaeon]|nr:hypothetical protein [archaeon]
MILLSFLSLFIIVFSEKFYKENETLVLSEENFTKFINEHQEGVLVNFYAVRIFLIIFLALVQSKSFLIKIKIALSRIRT